MPFLTVAVCFISTASAVRPLAAQERHRVKRAPTELLANYERSGGESAASGDITHPSEVLSLLDGLERIILGSGPPRMRAEAVYKLSVAASGHTPRPMPGIFARLERVYRGSDDYGVRHAVLAALGEIATDRTEAIVFLKRTASEEQYDFAVGTALTSLMLQGEEGRAALRRLHDARAVKPTEARQILETMAKNGYQLPK